MPGYSPAPLDTSDIKLPASLSAQLERIAENIHDLWAQERLRHGWSYGPKRDDKSKKHPGLVPYATLPDSEKHYDRTIAGETIKMVLKLGYTLLPPATN